MTAPASQTPRAGQATVRRPWADDPRADAKDALLNYALEHVDGARISCAARRALDSEPGKSDADYNLARRFYLEDYAHLFKTTRRGWYWWVEPRPVAFLLKSSRRSAYMGSDGSGNPRRASGSVRVGAPGGRAATTVRGVLRDRCQLSWAAGGVRGALVHGLAAHREGVDSVGMRPDRVSSVGRVAARQAEFLGGFEAGTARYGEGTLMTLTSRVGESGDLLDGLCGVYGSLESLRRHLKGQTPGDSRPPTVAVLDLTKSGLAHLHVVVFGVRPDGLDRDALTGFWHGARGHGYISHFARVERRAGRLVFAEHAVGSGSETGRYVREYLGGGLRALRAVAEADPEVLHAVAEGASLGRDGGFLDREGAWKVAAIWAAGLPFVSVSTTLKESSAWLSARGRNRRRGAGVGSRLSSTPTRPSCRREQAVHSVETATPVSELLDRPPPTAPSSCETVRAHTVSQCRVNGDRAE